MGKKISIIIPVYNGEPFLPKLIESISIQSFKNFEVIFVDDKSTDNTVKIIKQEQKKYPYIKLYELKTNSGAGAARNFGLKKAKGDYIFFNDSDDWLNNNALQEINQHLIENDFPDLVVFSFSVFDENYNYLWSNTNIENFDFDKTTGSKLFKEYCNGTLNPSPWNKVFKRSIWTKNNIFYPTDIHHQDLAAIPLACYKAETVTILKKRLYNYYSNSKGVSLTASDKHVYSPYKALEFQFDFFLKEGQETFKIWKSSLIRMAFLHFDYNFRIRKHLFNDEQVINYISLFNEFCLKYKIEANYLLNSNFTYGLITNFLAEKLRRGIDKSVIAFSDEYSFEKLFEHYTIINNQNALLLKQSNEDKNSFTNKINELSKIVDTNKKRINDLELEKSQYIKRNSELVEASKKLEIELSHYSEKNKKLKETILKLEYDNQLVLEKNMELTDIKLKSESYIKVLETEKGWYQRTYDHLPKFYLKIGGIFRRWPFIFSSNR